MDAFQALMQQLVDNIGRVDDNRRSSQAIHFSIVTLLIDSGVTTTDKFSERLALSQRILGKDYQTDEITQRLNLLVGYLKDSAASGDPSKPKWTPMVIEGGQVPEPKE